MSSAVAIRELIERTKTLDSSDFEVFVAEILEIRDSRSRSPFEVKEAELLKKLGRRMPKTQRQRMDFLMKKMNGEQISDLEKKELDGLVEAFEKVDFIYAKTLVELAQHRKTTVPQVLDHFNLRHAENG